MELQVVNNPIGLIEKAIASGSSIETMERLFDLHQKWEKNEAMKAFNNAMNDFQANKPEIIKTKGVEHEKNGVSKKMYSFAPLPEIQKAIDPVLSSVGLTYSWRQREESGRITITCILKHVAGHSEETELTSSPDASGAKNSIQAIGSAVSYLKRYTLMNACGLSADDDNDGNSSGLTKEEEQDLQKTKIIELQAEKADKITDKLNKRIEEILKNNEVDSYAKCIINLKQL